MYMKEEALEHLAPLAARVSVANKLRTILAGMVNQVATALARCNNARAWLRPRATKGKGMA
jgi:hypothetical protein